MATRMKMLKLLQEMRGFAYVTNRRPLSRQAGILAMQLRSHLLTATARKEKRVLSIAMQDLPDIPNPVKITHLQSDGQPAATLNAD